MRVAGVQKVIEPQVERTITIKIPAAEGDAVLSAFSEVYTRPMDRKTGKPRYDRFDWMKTCVENYIEKVVAKAMTKASARVATKEAIAKVEVR